MAELFIKKKRKYPDSVCLTNQALKVLQKHIFVYFSMLFQAIFMLICVMLIQGEMWMHMDGPQP